MFKGLILAFVMMYFICGCLQDLSYENEQDWIAREDESAPLSLKETKFQDSLSQNGFITHIDKKFIGRIGEGNSPYYVEVFCNHLNVTAENVDSLEKFRKELAIKLYRSVISDSVLYDIVDIRIEFKKLNYDTGIDGQDFFPIKHYSKSYFKILNQFKIIKDKKGRYKRVSLQ